MAEVGKANAERQAAFNAKYAGEQKARADMLELALAQANSDKAALQQQKVSDTSRQLVTDWIFFSFNQLISEF